MKQKLAIFFLALTALLAVRAISSIVLSGFQLTPYITGFTTHSATDGPVGAFAMQFDDLSRFSGAA